MALSFAALAQPSAADKAAAEALFQQGKALLEKGELDKACAKLDASQRLDVAVGTLLFLGDCYERLGKKASAWVTFKEAASIADREGDERKKIAEVRRAALEPQVSYLQVSVATPVEGMVVRRNGVEVARASWGTPIPVDAGDYRIEATAPGRQRWSTTLAVADGGDTFSVDVPMLGEAAIVSPPAEPVPAPPAPPPSADESEASGSGMLIAGAVIGGAGVVGLVIGGVFGLMAKSSNDDSLGRCRTESFCSQEGLDLREEARDRATISTALFVAGGTLTAGGIALIIAGATREDAEQGRAPRVQLSSFLGPGQAGLRMGGRF